MPFELPVQHANYWTEPYVEELFPVSIDQGLESSGLYLVAHKL